MKNPQIKLPGLIFLDLNMPRMNGWQCLAQIRKIETLKKIPVIIFSTSKENEEFANASMLGNVYYMTKPTRLSELVLGIKHAISGDWDAIREMNKAGYV